MSRHGELHIVSYDIPQDRRRNRMATTLLGFGDRVQESVFECYLDARERKLLLARIRAVANKQEDNIRIYRLCATCERRLQSIGLEPPRIKRVYIV